VAYFDFATGLIRPGPKIQTRPATPKGSVQR
jgi:hypothetical protein